MWLRLWCGPLFDTDPRRDAGAVERGGLENRCARKCTEGSNPSLSAIKTPAVWRVFNAERRAVIGALIISD